MHRLSLLTLTLLAVLGGLVLPAAASASPAAIYADCEDNARLDGRYGDADLRKAARDIPQDIDEYSNCRELIEGALAGVDTTGALPRGLPAGNGVGSVPLGPTGKPIDPRIDATPDERADLVGAGAGEDIRPSAAGVRPGAPGGDLPVPLIVALVLAALAALAAGAPRLMQLARARTA